MRSISNESRNSPDELVCIAYADVSCANTLAIAQKEQRQKKEGKRREARVTQEFAAAVLEGQITYLSLLVSVRPVNTAVLSHGCPRLKSWITPQNATKQRTVHV